MSNDDSHMMAIKTEEMGLLEGSVATASSSSSSTIHQQHDADPPIKSGDEVSNNDDDEEESEEEGESESESEGFYKPPEPLYDKANAIQFRTLCHRFETMWKQKSKKKKPSKDELLAYLLSSQLRRYLHGGPSSSSSSSSSSSQPKRAQSIFPMLRLMTPDKDTTRPRLWMKEKLIADTWATALGLSKQGSDYKKLVRYNDPTAAGLVACGDISMCVYEVVQKRFPELGGANGKNNNNNKKKSGQKNGTTGGAGGGVTVGRMNELLDELAGITGGETTRGTNAGGWDASRGVASLPRGGATGTSRLSKKQRVDWVSKLVSMKFTVSQCSAVQWNELK